jgi:hypothetical protein
VTASGAVAMLASAVAVATTLPATVLALEIQVIAVHAAETGPTDPQLASLRPRLRRLVSYRSFQVVQDETRRCRQRDTEEFLLPGGRILHLVPKSMDGETILMKVRLLDDGRRLVDTDVRMRNGGTLLFGVGHDGPGGQGLLIVLRAEQ